MEIDQKFDQREMKAMEEELLSDAEDDDVDDNELDHHLDSPYPSDSESDDESEFIITDKLKLW